jgi:hypothetical protein
MSDEPLEQTRFPGPEFAPGVRPELAAFALRGDAPEIVAALQLGHYLMNVPGGPWCPVPGDASELIRGAARTDCGVSLANEQVPAMLALAGLRSDYGPAPEGWGKRAPEIMEARRKIIAKARQYLRRKLAALDALEETPDTLPE